ncbi:hypothetical protein ACLOJK_022501 [Asimina triloba]
MKEPTDGIFENSLTLHHNVRLALLAYQVAEIADPYLPWEETYEVVQSGDSKRKTRDCLGSIARVGVESPRERMKMKEVRTSILGSVFKADKLRVKP